MVSLKLILDGIRTWETQRTTDATRDENVRQRVATAVEPYLGGRATNRLIKMVAADNSNLLPTVERTLASFVGAKAAGTIVERAMDQVFLRG